MSILAADVRAAPELPFLLAEGRLVTRAELGRLIDALGDDIAAAGSRPS